MSKRSLMESLLYQFQFRIGAFKDNVELALDGARNELNELIKVYGKDVVVAELGEFATLVEGKNPSRHKPSSRRKKRPAAKKAAKAPKKSSRKKRRRSNSAKVSESRQVQGTYLSLLKKVPAARRDHFKQITKDSGRHAAIEAMQKELKKE